MRLVAGSKPAAPEVLGVYGTSRLRAALAWAYVGVLIISGLASGWREPHGWETVADLVWLGLWVSAASLMTFAPSLVITRSGIERRLRRPVAWSEVAEVLAPSRFGQNLRVRLDDRTVLELRGVTPDRAGAVHGLTTAS